MTRDRRDAVQHEADELAAEAFDRYPLDVEKWVHDALVGEWGDNAESAAKEVMAAAIAFGSGLRVFSDAGVRVIRAVAALRDAYVDHASVRGLYAAEAEDAINTAVSDEAERLRDLLDDQVVDAYQAGVRG